MTRAEAAKVRRFWTEAERKRAGELRQSGMIYAEIAAELGRSLASIQTEFGAKRNRPAAAARKRRPLPAIATSDFIEPPSLARLMAGR